MSRDDIPRPIRRQLRQEAGFGCCVCGNPIYDYHHIKDWAEVLQHNPADMMLLCPQHHRQATAHALTESDQRRAKAEPFNIKAGTVNGFLYVNDHPIGIEAGSVQLVGTVEIEIDGESIFRLAEDEDGHLLLSLRLYNNEGDLLIRIDENEWISGNPMPWDFEFAFRTIVLRKKKGEIALRLDLTKFPGELQASLRKNGRTVESGRNGLIFNSGNGPAGFGNLALVNVLFIMDSWTDGVITRPADGQELLGMVSWPIRDERFERALRVYQQSKAQSANS